MKTTYLYIFLFSILFVFTGCEKDSNESDNPDPISGCMDNTACNYNSSATDEDNNSCIYVDGICETCEDGVIVDNDADDDGICDADEIIGCMDINACNYDTSVTDEDDTLCFYDYTYLGLNNAIEFTYIEDNVSGLINEDINAYIDIRNASCETSMWGLEARRLTANPIEDEIYFTFCINEYCYNTLTMAGPALNLAPGEETNDATRFKSTLFSNEPGVYEVTYRFYLNSVQGVMLEHTITYTVN
tara:strand:- start:116 stop:850 length:735 start_codon:yes stop_codon:yes gene_type:complete